MRTLKIRTIYSGYETITLNVGGTIDISDYLEGTGYVYRPGVKKNLVAVMNKMLLMRLESLLKVLIFMLMT